MRPATLKDALSDKLSKEELEQLVRSYDVLGSIAIIEIPETLKKHEARIAQAILDTHKHIQTVLKKAEQHSGEFRTQKLSLLAGEDTRETLIKESGCLFLVDVEQVYFSIRLSTERLRIASLVQPGEHVLVLFSGAAPYVVVLSKKSLAERIVGVEKNPVGHRYGLENVRLNKVKNAELFCADCADLSFLKEPFDSIVMPAPANAPEFIAEALKHAKDEVKLHVYCFGQEHEVPLLISTIETACAAAGFHASQFFAAKTGQPAPYTFRYCIDCVCQRH